MNFPPPTPKQAHILWAALTGLGVAVLVGLVVGFCWVVGFLLQEFYPVLLPLAVAGIIAYLLDPLVDGLEARGVPRARAIICVFALAFVIAGAVVGSVLPRIITETRDLVERIPGYMTRMQHRVEYWINNPPASLNRWLNYQPPATVQTNVTDIIEPLEPVLTNAPTQSTATGPSGRTLLKKAFTGDTIQSATNWLAATLPTMGSWLFGQVARVASWLGLLAGLLLIPVYAFYLLLEKHGIARNWSNYLPVANSELKDEIVFVLGSINECLISFFRGQVLVALCDGALYIIGFLSIGLPYAFLIGALAIVLTMVPYLGAAVTCVAALVIAIAQFGDWLHPMLVLIVFAVVQAIEGLIISPKIMGDRVGLHPLTIIIAVMAGTTLMGGILGGILAIPLTAALRALMFRYVWKVQAEARGRQLLRP